MTRAQEIQYVKEAANDYDVDFNVAWTLFDMLGPSEMYDGFITMLEDYANGY